MNKKIRNFLSAVAALFCAGSFSACSSMSKNNLRPVNNFRIERYLGNWYEIGRFDFKWEKNLKNVRANYSMNRDGTVKVTNSGYDFVSQKEKQSIGKAKFAGKYRDMGSLKVSFFGPFYSAYTVIALDPDYNYALVAGANKKLLWILSRTPSIPDDVRENYVQIAKSVGYDLTDFVWTIQE